MDLRSFGPDSILASRTRPADPAPPSREAATLRGTSPSFSITALLEFLSTHQKTGTLRVHRESETYLVEFQHGMVVHATSDHRPIEELLGSILLDRCAVDADKLGDLIERCQRDQTMLGEALHHARLVSTDELVAALELQIRLLFQRLAEVDDSWFEFVENEPSPPSVHVGMGVMELLLESARALDHRHRDESLSAPTA